MAPLDDISIGWAIEIDTVQLGARLEAYGETKAIITAFTSVNHHLISPLPSEVLVMIGDEVQYLSWREKFPLWQMGRVCCEAACEDDDHFSSQELHDDYGVGCRDDSSSDYESDSYFEKSRERHKERAQSFLAKVGGDGEKALAKRMARHQSLFAHDSGVYVLFCPMPEFELDYDGYPDLESASKQAYLSLPLTTHSMLKRASSQAITDGHWMIDSQISKEHLNLFSPQQAEQRLKAAVHTLGLDGPHTRDSLFGKAADCTCEVGDDDELLDDSLEIDDERARSHDSRESLTLLNGQNRSGGNNSASMAREDASTKVSKDCSHSSTTSDGADLPCMECQINDHCHGLYEMDSPELMILSAGRVKTYVERGWGYGDEEHSSSGLDLRYQSDDYL